MPLIYIFGLDGSGKTTIGKKVYDYIQATGNSNVKLEWMRGSHTFAFLLNKFFLNFGIFRDTDNPYYTLKIPGSFRNIWRFLEFTALQPVLITRFLLPASSKSIIIADRYIPDFIVWVATTSRWENYLESVQIKFLIALSRKADVKIYLTTKPDVLMKRKNGLSASFILKQIQVYDTLSAEIGVIKLDTTYLSIDESLTCILKLIRPYIR